MTPLARLRAIPLLLAIVTLWGCGGDTGTNPDPDPDPDPTISLSIDASADSLLIGETLQLDAVFDPASGSQPVTWSSSSPTTGAVDSDGLVEGVSPGEIVITATGTTDPSLTASLTLQVNDCPTPRMVTADITADATWENWLDTPLCFDYVALDETEVTGALLTIEPGVIAGFQGDRLLVSAAGGLDATGTADDPILLTGWADGFANAPGFWDGVMLRSSQHASNRIAHTTIEYGGGSNFGAIPAANLFFTEGTRMPIEAVTLQWSAGYGAHIGLTTEMPGGFNGGEITDNTTGAVHVHARRAYLLSAGATRPTIDGNLRDAIDVVASNIEADGTWAAFGAHYNILAAPIKLAVQAELTLEPGAHIVFELDQAMSVSSGGSLQAAGTLSEPIRLTGAIELAGSWRGLQIEDTSTLLEWVQIAHGGGPGGSGSLQPANLKLSLGATGVNTRLTMRNTVLTASAGYGLSAVAGDIFLDGFDANTLSGNVLGPAYLAATQVHDLGQTSSFLGNGEDRIVVTAATIDSDDVTWRDHGLPYYLIGVGATPVFSVLNSLFTIEAGVELLMSDNFGWNVRESSFTAEGTEQNRIRFDAESSGWRGIQIFEGAASFDYADLINAGTSSWGGVNEPASVSVTATAGTSTASFTGNVTSVGATYGVAFSFGDTFAQGCITPYIPPPDQVSDHCRPG